jgi:hypothetical protein
MQAHLCNRALLLRARFLARRPAIYLLAEESNILNMHKDRQKRYKYAYIYNCIYIHHTLYMQSSLSLHSSFLSLNTTHGCTNVLTHVLLLMLYIQSSPYTNAHLERRMEYKSLLSHSTLPILFLCHCLFTSVSQLNKIT